MPEVAKSAIELAHMTPAERRAELERVAFPGGPSKRQSERMSNLSDEQVTEALSVAIWLHMTADEKEGA